MDHLGLALDLLKVPVKLCSCDCTHTLRSKKNSESDDRCPKNDQWQAPLAISKRPNE